MTHEEFMKQADDTMKGLDELQLAQARLLGQIEGRISMLNTIESALNVAPNHPGTARLAAAIGGAE